MPSSGRCDCLHHNSVDLPVARLGLRIIRTDLVNTCLKVATLTQHFRELSHSRRGVQQTSGVTTSEHDDIECSQLEPDRRYCFEFDPSTPVYTELFDCAASIITYAQHQPQLLIEAVFYDFLSRGHGISFSKTKVGFIAMNRILHPYFTDASVTTDFLLEAITYQTRQCLINSHDSMNTMGPRSNIIRFPVPFAMFIDKLPGTMAWNSTQQPLPLTPNNSWETLLTTLLKFYAIRVDVTLFFKELWSPVLPSIISTIRMPIEDCSSAFKSLIKVATRLLSHTFSEKSMIMLPATATAVSQALYAVIGIEGLHIYLFDLLILPNIVKILSLADDDFAGGDVLQQSNACYDRSTWWPENSHGVYNPVRSLVWMVWRLYSGAVGITGQALSSLSAEKFFIDDASLNSSSMSDQRLQNLLFTLSRAIAKSTELIVRLPVDANTCNLFDIDRGMNSEEMNAVAALTADALDRRLTILVPKPAEMLQLLVISRYEVSTFFEAVMGSLNATATRGQHNIQDGESDSFLRDGIMCYKMLENSIQRDVPLASQRVSEQMMLKLSSAAVPALYGGLEEEDIKETHRQLSNGLHLASSYQVILLDRLQQLQGGMKSKSKLCDRIEQGQHCFLATQRPSDISTHTAHTSTPQHYHDLRQTLATTSDTMSRENHRVRPVELYRAATESYVLKVTPPHRGITRPVKPLERAEEIQAEYDDVARKKRERLQVYLMNSQATSSCTGSRYTKVDDDILNSTLLQDTESRKHFASASALHRAGAGSDLYSEGDCTNNTTYSSSENICSGRSFKSQGSPSSRTPSKAFRRTSKGNVSERRGMQYPLPLTESKAQPFPEHLRSKIQGGELDKKMQDQRQYEIRKQESVMKQREEESDEERDELEERVLTRTEHQAHHLLADGRQHRLNTIRYPSRDPGPQHPNTVMRHTGPGGIRGEGSNRSTCVHVAQIHRDKNPFTRIDGPSRERFQYNGLKTDKQVNRYEHCSQPNDSSPVSDRGKRTKQYDEHDKDGGVEHKYGYKHIGEEDEGEGGGGPAGRSVLDSNPEDSPSEHGCYSDKQRQRHPRLGVAAALDSDRRCEGILPDKNQNRVPFTHTLGGKLGSDSSITENYMSASLSSYQIANKLRGRESCYSPCERPTRSKSAGGATEPHRMPTSQKRTARSTSPRRQDGHSVTQGHYMGHMCKTGDVSGASSEPNVHHYPQALSPSLVQPPFRPTGWGGSLCPAMRSEPHGESRDEYRFCTRELSPSKGGPFLKAVRRRSSDEQEHIMRSAARERLLQPSRPTGERLCSARPAYNYRQSPSTLSDTPSKFLRAISEGITPNLREYEDYSNGPSRCVFRPLGGSCDIPIPLQLYDERLKSALSNSTHSLSGTLDRGLNRSPISMTEKEGQHLSPRSTPILTHPTPIPTLTTTPAPTIDPIPLPTPPSPDLLELLEPESMSLTAADLMASISHNGDVANSTVDSSCTSSPHRHDLIDGSAAVLQDDLHMSSESYEDSPRLISTQKEGNAIEEEEYFNPLHINKNVMCRAEVEEDTIEAESALLSHELAMERVASDLTVHSLMGRLITCTESS